MTDYECSTSRETMVSYNSALRGRLIDAPYLSVKCHNNQGGRKRASCAA
jgi:hypothetical protein